MVEAPKGTLRTTITPLVIKVVGETPHTIKETETTGDQMTILPPLVLIKVSLTIEAVAATKIDRTTNIIREEIITLQQLREGRLANLGKNAESLFQEILVIAKITIQGITIKTNLGMRTLTEAPDKTEIGLHILISKANTSLDL